MSVSFRTRVGAVAIGLSGLALAAAVAQQATTQNPQNPNAPTQSQLDPANPNLGRPDANGLQTGQPGRATPGRQPYSANFRGEQGNVNSMNAVEKYFANCLLKKNQAEVELSQFAAEQTENPQVRQFAQMLVKDHREIVNRLQQVAGTGGLKSTDSTNSTSTSLGTSGVNATPGLPSTPASETATPSVGNVGDGRLSRAGQNSNIALMQVADLEQKIADRCHKALREELQGKSGAEFDECFIGAQVGGHMHMLAALEVLSQESQGELKQIAEAARPSIEKHLDEAKQLAKQLKERDQGSATAARTTRSTER